MRLQIGDAGLICSINEPVYTFQIFIILLRVMHAMQELDIKIICWDHLRNRRTDCSEYPAVAFSPGREAGICSVPVATGRVSLPDR